MFTTAELARLTGLPYMTVKNQMVRGWCAWPRRIMDKRTSDPAYKCWENMCSRCHNPRATGYENYGGRGIKLNPEWLDFSKFLAYIGPRPSLKHSIDRLDVNGHYEPGNVRWALPITQARNSRQFKGGSIRKHGRKYRVTVGDWRVGDFNSKQAADVALEQYLRRTTP